MIDLSKMINEEGIIIPDRKKQENVVLQFTSVYESYVKAHKQEQILDRFILKCFNHQFCCHKQTGKISLSRFTEQKRGVWRADTHGIIPLYHDNGITGGVEQSMPEEKAILLPEDGKRENIRFVCYPFWADDTIFRILPKQEYDFSFLYGLLKNQADLSLDTNSDDQSVLPMESLNYLEIPLFPEKLRIQFQKEMKPFFSEINTLRKKQRMLTTIFYDLCERYIPQYVCGGVSKCQ